MSEKFKYTLRFGFTILIAVLAAGLLGATQVKIVLYKVSMVAVGVALAEIIWVVFFKPVYGKTERIDDNERLKAVLIFRGIFYASIILALTLGL
jgi:hypothetical protein